MDPLQLVELAAAALILTGGVFLYRRKPAKGDSAADAGDGRYGSQGAVLLFVIAIIIAIHGSGALQYHPSASEIETYQGLKQMSGH